MPINRDRSAQHKVYIPSNARENQYILAKFELTDALLARFSDLVESGTEFPYNDFYHHLAAVFHDICDKHEIDSGQFVANDKFIRVRYSPEKITAQTDQQIVFLYSPKYHSGHKSYINGKRRVRKLKLLFLANGSEIRHNSAKFHTKVDAAMQELIQTLELDPGTVRLCDHQHLTYDLFAKEKGVEGTQAHKLRSIVNRFSVHDVHLDANQLDSQTYAVVSMHLNKRMRSLVTIDKTAEKPYEALYTYIKEAFINSSKANGVDQGIMIANDLVPVVRSKTDTVISENGELQTIDFNENKPEYGFTCHYSRRKLVDTVQFVFVAAKDDQTSYGYGKFLNQVHDAMRSFANKMEYQTKTENLSVRIHQHIGLNL
ncbi:DUF3083 family protein [Gayadomonas joobiniege]|uniref:DUF3083 family protein n=1 Tax=Gayadomonas joobiniege TaxID=1234606 RepID=UPI000381A793|nr:DUF3083 family protein [Gayadomonas joobiniege]